MNKYQKRTPFYILLSFLFIYLGYQYGEAYSQEKIEVWKSGGVDYYFLIQILISMAGIPFIAWNTVCSWIDDSVNYHVDKYFPKMRNYEKR